MFHCFRVSENVSDKRGGIRVLPPKGFCLTDTEVLVREPFYDVLQKKTGSEKNYG